MIDGAGAEGFHGDGGWFDVRRLRMKPEPHSVLPDLRLRCSWQRSDLA